MNIILIFVLIFLSIQKNQANNNNAADYLKSLKSKDFRDRVYNLNAKHNQGIWFRIGKRSISHDLKLHFENSHESNLPDYENLKIKDKLLNIDPKMKPSIEIKSDKIKEHKIKENKFGFIKSINPKKFRDRVNNINAKYNQGIWFRIG
jgi:hypothetical protein